MLEASKLKLPPSPRRRHRHGMFSFCSENLYFQVQWQKRANYKARDVLMGPIAQCEQRSFFQDCKIFSNSVPYRNLACTWLGVINLTCARICFQSYLGGGHKLLEIIRLFRRNFSIRWNNNAISVTIIANRQNRTIRHYSSPRALMH